MIVTSADITTDNARDSTTRLRLLEATAQIMREEGYTAATSRRVAAKAGVKSALVHYYFPRLDDLYVAVFRRGAEASLARQQQALADERPMHALWHLNSDPHGAQLLMEFMALANHRKEIRSEIASYAERYRDIESAALTLVLRQHGVDLQTVPAVAVSIMLASVTRMLVLESALGITRGHREMLQVLQNNLDRFEAPPPAAVRKSRKNGA